MMAKDTGIRTNSVQIPEAAKNNMWGIPRQVEQSMTDGFIRNFVAFALASGLLAGCMGGFNPFSRDAAADTSVATQKSVKLIDRDIEAPNVYQANDEALWDGRPSLGGVWVASSDATDPERVIMRNPANGKFVIGALFKRERDNPGPRLQISSDAAAALGLLAGQPAKISVTALRRDEAVAKVDANQPMLDTAETVQAEGATITVDGLPPLQPAPAQPVTAQPVTAQPVTAQPVTATLAAPPAATPKAPTVDGGNGQMIQIGLFSIEANAKRALATLNAAGIPASIRESTSKGKPLWSVTARGDAARLAKVKAAGFQDAYFLKG